MRKAMRQVRRGVFIVEAMLIMALILIAAIATLKAMQPKINETQTATKAIGDETSARLTAALRK